VKTRPVLPLVALAVGLSLSATACAADDPTASSGSPGATAGASSAATSPDAPASPESGLAGAPNTGAELLEGVEVHDAADGTPAITLPALGFTVPSSCNRVLTAGDGPVVGPGDAVEVDYAGVNGRTGEVFDSSYARQAPAAFALTGVVAGFAKGLVGQTVGSRVLLAMPPEDGYGPNGNTRADIQGTDTILFVVDILGVV
jgi:peptidylprolyl isomerase